ncbi:MAG: hypothetical protein PWQ51_761 [Methanolobus sp.]|jgi:hypothetical protein|uniref:Uncharacterized protein n=1 Tax=Methanolobus tindarius DSM 2278 TaxID=1090322 RepID=W9DQR2_METTI|nr:MULTISPECIES: hypothetical protein [Methanolobus]ETA68939.1 hypothetical protein MettiDRAFT_2428 [Methanolobus tindarius DSM 2278]MDK2830253.1 hypothetical protein [Methanolobus sp.]MDK2938597.1 hypothetical protein [Methanolobus sp.]
MKKDDEFSDEYREQLRILYEENKETIHYMAKSGTLRRKTEALELLNILGIEP